MQSDNIPLYIQIANAIKNDIETKIYSFGDLLPTEENLIKEFKASRTTIRSAIGLLENEGLVVRKQGKGTIVNQRRPAQKLNHISSLTETFESKGVLVGSINVSIELVESPQKVIRAFQLSNPEDVYVVRRTRVINKEPIAFVNNYLRAEKVPGLHEKTSELSGIGLYRLIERDYDIELKHAVENISVYLSGPLESEILHIAENTPLFHSVRTTYLQDNTPFELVTSIIKVDKYEYTVYLEGRPSRNK